MSPTPFVLGLIFLDFDLWRSRSSKAWSFSFSNADVHFTLKDRMKTSSIGIQNLYKFQSTTDSDHTFFGKVYGYFEEVPMSCFFFLLCKEVFFFFFFLFVRGGFKHMAMLWWESSLKQPWILLDINIWKGRRDEVYEAVLLQNVWQKKQCALRLIICTSIALYAEVKNSVFWFSDEWLDSVRCTLRVIPWPFSSISATKRLPYGNGIHEANRLRKGGLVSVGHSGIPNKQVGKFDHVSYLAPVFETPYLHQELVDRRR